MFTYICKTLPGERPRRGVSLYKKGEGTAPPSPPHAFSLFLIRFARMRKQKRGKKGSRRKKKKGEERHRRHHNVQPRRRSEFKSRARINYHRARDSHACNHGSSLEKGYMCIHIRINCNVHMHLHIHSLISNKYW